MDHVGYTLENKSKVNVMVLDTHRVWTHISSRSIIVVMGRERSSHDHNYILHLVDMMRYRFECFSELKKTDCGK